ncbi:hypothetical protein JW921_11405 [Candidatus Fermentibacterales bacterium]|nr:hypothetical protein [Candidatus Fermentibacterales bacterium]
MSRKHDTHPEHGDEKALDRRAFFSRAIALALAALAPSFMRGRTTLAKRVAHRRAMYYRKLAG